MHGPASDLGGSFKAPTWPRLPRISVLDTVAPVLGPIRRTMWRLQRDAALDRWETSGLVFGVVEGDPDRYPKFDPDYTDEITHLTGLMVHPFLRLMAMPHFYGSVYSEETESWIGGVQAAATWMPGGDPGSLMAVKLGKAFWLMNPYNRAYIMTHEIGHALGLNHRPQFEDNKSVMSGSGRISINPDAHDIDSLKTYYSL